MSTIPDFCCDTKCITIKKCDGPWCLGAARKMPSCPRPAPPECCPDTSDHEYHGAKLSVGSNAACCGTLRVCDTLELLKADGTTVTLTIRYIGNGVIVAKGGGKGYRLEGYKGHLVHVSVYSAWQLAVDGQFAMIIERYNTYKACANGNCSVPTCSSTDGSCGCPCADGAAEDTGGDTESVVDDDGAQNNDDAQGDGDEQALLL